MSEVGLGETVKNFVTNCCVIHDGKKVMLNSILANEIYGMLDEILECCHVDTDNLVVFGNVFGW